MKFKLIFSLLACFMSLSMFAESATTEFTYANGELKGYGRGKKEYFDIAMCIDNPALAGKKITGFKAYINTLEGISNTSLWMTKELKLDDKINVPDIASYDVTPVESFYGGIQLGMLEIQLPEPYVLTDEPLYLGYSITVDDNETEGQKYPIIISMGANPNGFFLHESKAVLRWTEYSTTLDAVALIVATLEGDFQEHSLGIKGYEPIFAADGSSFNVELNVINSGAAPVESVSYIYSIDGNLAGSEKTVNLPAPITPNISISCPLLLQFEGIEGVGKHSLEITVTKINGSENMAVDKSILCNVDVFPFIPVHRPLVEECTGLWCQYCLKGYIAMELIAEDYSDSQVSICYHDGDAMAVIKSFPYYVSGLPSTAIDRTGEIDPYFGSTENTQFGISFDLEKAMAKLAIASIDLDATLAGTRVDITSTCKFITEIENANYQVGYVLVGNGLSDPKWKQTNAFSGATGLAGTPLEVLATWPDPVAGLVYNDIAIEATNMMGVPGSLPEEIEGNREYSHDITLDISDNSLALKAEELIVTAFIIDKNSGLIINANKIPIGKLETGGDDDDNGVVSVKGDVTTKVFYDLYGRKVNNPGKGLYIMKETLGDGTTRATKVMTGD